MPIAATEGRAYLRGGSKGVLFRFRLEPPKKRGTCEPLFDVPEPNIFLEPTEMLEPRR